MKKITLIFFLITSLTFSQVTITPYPFSVTQSITITIDENSSLTDCNGFNNPNKVYMHSGIGDNSSAWGFSVVGNWGQDDGVGQMTNNGNGTWSITITPKDYFGLNPSQEALATRMGMVFRNENGSQEFKDNNCTDFFFDVGAFQITLVQPGQSLSVVSPGSSLPIVAQTSMTANFVLKANDIVVDAQSGITNYSYNYVVNENTDFLLEATNNGIVKSAAFQAVLSPNEAPVPNGLKDGINLDSNDPTKATLVLYAPNKSIVHVIGDFNNWQMDNAYAMNKDSSKNRFWIELNGLTPQHDHMYQYLIDLNLRVADPYSTLILDEDDDPYIDSATFPNLPSYPTGLTTQAITWLRTGDPVYNWQTTNFVRPDKTDLVVYELLIRDFDALHSFDAVKSRLDYLQSLGINAIELLPVSEFSGNLSWGYNPNFHMALDKYYGSPVALKQLIDECHSRGIAVILDVVYNQADWENPYYRMWGPGENPFFNQSATHSYSVFNDFNHSLQATRDYVKRTAQYWIEEFHIDGFRWDLTKGFTQNCPLPANPTEEDYQQQINCTDSYQQDRVDVLKLYADYQWEVDPDFYIIFEHLGGITEEKEWANYRANEGKGIMLWNNQNGPYNEATMGWNNTGQSNFSNVSYKVKGFDGPSAISYMESHDEERLMYKNLQYGNVNGSYSVKNLNTALERIETAGAFFFTVPGPKMIWQFGELGYDFSINYCSNGTVDNACRTDAKPIKWDYFDNANRKAIYDTWTDLIKLKLNEPIFRTTNFTLNTGATSGLKTIHLTLDSATGDEIKYVTVIGNFGVTTQNISPNFQEIGDWFEFLNENQKLIVTNVNQVIALAPGEYRIYGNNPSSLFPDNNIPDDDNDGVANTDDLCPGTPLGTTVDVTGCPVFTLPSDNFIVQISSETCRSSNNGSISITAQQNLNYSINVIGNGVNMTDTFVTNFSLNNLSAGDYTACITVDGQPDYEICFDVTVNEPEDLSVYSFVSNSDGLVSIQMSGSANYKVTFNETSFETTENSLELNLKTGVNSLSIEGDQICQGVYEETIYYNSKMTVFPNPVTNNQLSVYFGNEQVSEAKLTIFSILGEVVYNQTVKPKNNLVQLDFKNFSKGIYILNININNENTSFKVIN